MDTYKIVNRIHDLEKKREDLRSQIFALEMLIIEDRAQELDKILEDQVNKGMNMDDLSFIKDFAFAARNVIKSYMLSISTLFKYGRDWIESRKKNQENLSTH